MKLLEKQVLDILSSVRIYI